MSNGESTIGRGAALARTGELLAAVRRRLRGEILRHGSGTALAALAVGLTFAFLVDRTLHVPRAVRLLFLVALVAVPLWLLRRELFAHWKRIPGAAGLAQLVERRHPALHDVLSSAVELRARDDVPPALLARVCAEAETRSGEVELRRLFDGRGPRRRLLGGIAAGLACAGLFAANSSVLGIFFARLVGLERAWPQRTLLAIELPAAEPPARANADEESLVVRVARGTDVPVIVRAEGVIPETVTLRFGGGEALVLAPAGGNAFRTLLRSLQADVTFHAVGGDDRDRVPQVTVRVLEPPDVAGLAVVVTPPPYAGLAPSTTFDADVEVLRGSAVTVYVRTLPVDATGVARFFPDDAVRELEERPWPLVEGAADAPRSLAFDVRAEETLRYRFELRDASGLANPDPGLFAIHVVADREPEVEILAPGRVEVEAVAGGALSLRVVAADDFGLSALSWSSTPVQGEAGDAVRADLAWTRLEPAGAERGFRALAAVLLDARALTTASELVEGQQFVLQVEARDVREPEAGVGRSVPLRVRIVSADEFMRRLQDRLARARLDAGELLELQRTRLARTLELLTALEGDGIDAAPDAGGGAGALSGQRRVVGDAGALTRELAGITEALVYARIDERSRTLLDALDAGLAAHADKSFHVETWREVVRLAAADRALAGSLSGRLAAALGIAIGVAEESAARAVEQLALAQDAGDVASGHQALDEAARAQRETIAGIEELVERLAEWDNFQSVLALTRDILNRQKNLLERTKNYAKEK